MVDSRNTPHTFPILDHHTQPKSRPLEGVKATVSALLSLLCCCFTDLPSFRVCRLRFYVIMTSQRELFPRLTADMRRFKKLPQIHRDPAEAEERLCAEPAEASASHEQDPWDQSPCEAAAACVFGDGNEFFPLLGGKAQARGLLYTPPLFPLLNAEVATARRKIQASVEQAMGHCRRDNLWRRLFHGEHLALDKLKLARLSFSELEELLDAVHSRSVGEIDPQLVTFSFPGLPHPLVTALWQPLTTFWGVLCVHWLRLLGRCLSSKGV